MAELFDFSTFAALPAPLRPHVMAPFGPLVVEVTIGNQSSNDMPVDALGSEDPSCTGFVFPFESATTELLICPVKPSLPTGKQVDQCLACVLRVASKRDNMSLAYRCAWSYEVDPPEDGASNGECLQAFTWDDGRTEISLGTLDEEGLCRDAASKVPERWKQPISAANLAGIYVESTGNRGIDIHPPHLMRGESCELYFAIAWGTYPEPKSDTWLAVDFSSPEHLRCWPGQPRFDASSAASKSL